MRNKFGLAIGLRERCGREPVTFLAARRRPEALKHNDGGRDPHEFTSARRVHARALVCLRLVGAARACLRVGGGNWLRAAPVSQGVGEGLWASWLCDSERLFYIQRNSGREGGPYLGEAQGAGAPTEPRTEPLVELKSAAREPLPCLEPCLEPYLER